MYCGLTKIAEIKKNKKKLALLVFYCNYFCILSKNVYNNCKNITKLKKFTKWEVV